MDYQEMMMAQNAPQIPSLASSGNSLGGILGTISANSAKNTAQSQAFAREQMQFQQAQNAKAMEFNSEQARLNREWQEMMSNTAHQREVADLKAAGLNPILSALGGNGASVSSGASASVGATSGAKGEVDTSVNAVLANVLGTIMSAQTNLEMANINAKTQEAVADKYTAMSWLVESMKESFQAKYPNTFWGAASSAFQSIIDILKSGGSLTSGGISDPKNATSAQVNGLLGDLSWADDFKDGAVVTEHGLLPLAEALYDVLFPKQQKNKF